MTPLPFNSQSGESAPTAPISAELARIVPMAHHEEFHNRTTDEQRLRISELIKMFDFIRSSPDGVVAACYRLAIEHPGAGFSAGNIKTLYYAYQKTRDWRVLIPRWKGPTALPPEFIKFFRTRVEQNRRENPARAVMMQVKDEWARGEPIEGYGTWRDYYATQFPERDVPERYPFGFFPRGWSQSNLYTKQSSKAERRLARRGFHAAKAYLPHMIRDTSGLRFMELLVIDDFETDILVEARNPRTGRKEICTCAGLLALDVATRTRVALGLKPRFKDENDKKISITRADVQNLLHSAFASYGLPKDYGVTILCENAAAAITDDVATMLQALLGVQVARTGLLHDKVLSNGFVERGGKPWEKGWIESMFNIAWNHAGAFAGQKGASYQLKPGDLEAKMLYAERLLAVEGLTADQVVELKTGFWKFDDALTAYERIFDFLDRRTKHDMQGFLEISDYALPDRPGLLTEEEANQLSRDELLTITPIPRKESPLERRARLTKAIAWVKPAEHVLALLLLTPKRVKLENHRITFSHLSEGYTFADADSKVMKLPEGSELLGYFDPAAPNKLWVTQMDGRFVDGVRRRGAVDIRDREAIAAEQGEISRLITKHILGPVRERHGDENAALLTLKNENDAKLAAFGAKPVPFNPAARKGLTAALQDGIPGAQPLHAASATSLAAAIAGDVINNERAAATARILEQAGRDEESLATMAIPTPTTTTAQVDHSGSHELL